MTQVRRVTNLCFYLIIWRARDGGVGVGVGGWEVGVGGGGPPIPRAVEPSPCRPKSRSMLSSRQPEGTVLVITLPSSMVVSPFCAVPVPVCAADGGTSSCGLGTHLSSTHLFQHDQLPATATAQPRPVTVMSVLGRCRSPFRVGVPLE